MRHAAWGEREFSGSGDDQLVAELEGELAVEDVERLVELVRVQGGPLALAGMVLSITET